MITTIKLINTSIVSHSYVCVCVCVCVCVYGESGGLPVFSFFFLFLLLRFEKKTLLYLESVCDYIFF